MKILEILIQLYFLSNGIIFSERFKKYEMYLYGIVITNNLILVLGLITAFFRTKKFIHQIQIGSVLCCVIGVLIFKTLTRVYKNYLFITTSRLLEDTIFGIENMRNKLENKMKKKFIPLLMGVFFSFFILFNVTFLALFTNSKIDYNNMDIYVVPDLFIFSSVDSLGEYLKIVWLQTTVFFPEMMAYLSLTMYTCYIVASLEVHVEEIHYLAKNFIYVVNSKSQKEAILQKSTQSEDPRNYLKLRKQFVIDVKQNFRKIVQFQQYNFQLGSFYFRLKITLTSL